MNKKLLIGFGVLGIVCVVLMSGCITKEKQEFCPYPYMQIGNECCLDKNNDKICDKDELGKEPTGEDELLVVKEEKCGSLGEDCCKGNVCDEGACSEGKCVSPVISGSKKPSTIDNLELQISQIQLNPRQLSFSDSKDEDPSIIQASDGTYWIAWFSDRSGNGDIWYKKSRNGINWTEPFQITTDPSNDYYPSLIQASDGTFWIAWFSDRSGNFDIWYSNSNDGTNWSPGKQITNDGSVDWIPSLIQDLDGTFWIAWSSNRSGNKDIWLSNSNDGRNWSIPIQLTINTNEDDFPHLIQSPDGNFMIVWARHHPDNEKPGYSNPTSEIFYSTSTDGITWAAPVQLTNDSSVDTLPCIYQDSGATYLISWTSDKTDIFGDILCSSITQNKQSNLIQLTSKKSSDYSPKIIKSLDGNYWMSWVSDRSGNLDVWYAIFNESDLN